MKKNNKGFVLIETLVVTVFVMAVFSVIYINFYPLAGEYERREFYDDVDSKYGTYWVKRFVQSNSYDFFKANGADATINSSKFYDFTCNTLSGSDKTLCLEMWNRLGVTKAVVTSYKISDFKTKIAQNSSGFSDGFVSYIEYLPDYTVPSLNGANYRVLVEFKKKTDDIDDASSETYYTYGNMEVVRHAS